MATSVLTCERVRNGKPTTTEMTASYQDTGHGLPHLYLFSDYSARLTDWRTRDTYRVEEIPTGMDGRAFLLHRAAEAVAADGPDADERYGVFVARNGQDGICECRGFQRFGRCKHHDALKGLIGAGHIDHPLAGPAPAATEAPF